MEAIITVNRDLMNMIDIESQISDIIKTKLGAKKATVRCITKNWQGHICPEFKGSADGLKLVIHGSINPYDMENSPDLYDMDIIIDLL